MPGQLKPTEILVKVRCATTNPADCKFPETGLLIVAILKFPNTPGLEISGEVVAVGKSVAYVTSGVTDEWIHALESSYLRAISRLGELG